MALGPMGLGYCTGYGLGPNGPQPKHSQESELGPNLIVSPYLS